MSHVGIKEKLVNYLEDTHAMEENVLAMVTSMINTTADREIRSELEHHKSETERHISSLAERLEVLGVDTSKSKVKGAAGLLGTMVKAAVDQARTDKPARNARDGFVTEHLEIAAYELLERIAQKAGDDVTAKVARENRADEEAMAKKIASTWDKVIDLTLEESGVKV